MLPARTCALISTLALLAVSAVAQEHPDGTVGCGDYNVATSGGAAIVPGTALVGGSNCDDCGVNVALPFSFPFYGTPFASVNVVSNGSLQFTGINSAFTNVCPLPTATLNNAIIPYWDDLLLTAGGNGIFTSTSGVMPNRIFNIEWRAAYFSGGGTANFEARLYETSGRIDFIYGTVTQGIASATGGLQLGTGPTIESLFCNGTGQAITSGLMVTYTCAGGGCTLSCPPNQTDPNDPGLCSSVQTYPPPTTGGTCGTVTCTPPSGSTFPVGLTTITCSASAGPTCSFTQTVDDTEPPAITCSADIELDLPPGSSGQNVDYDPPVSGDNCGIDSEDCQPPSGDVFPAGTTPVYCTAYDAAGNSATCSFNVILNGVSALEVPTMSRLGLAALALLLAGAALVVFRRNG